MIQLFKQPLLKTVEYKVGGNTLIVSAFSCNSYYRYVLDEHVLSEIINVPSSGDKEPEGLAGSKSTILQMTLDDKDFEYRYCAVCVAHGYFEEGHSESERDEIFASVQEQLKLNLRPKQLEELYLICREVNDTAGKPDGQTETSPTLSAES